MISPTPGSKCETPAAYPSTAAPVPRRLPLLWLAAGAAAMLLAGLLIGLALIRNTAASPPVVTSILRVVPGHWLEGLRWSPPSHFDQPSRTAMAISSDGRFIVYSAVKENPGPQDIPRLYLRRTDQLGAAPIAGTEGGLSPFLSPDDRWVGFWAGEFSKNGKLMKVAVDGGVPLTLCDAAQPFGASWGAENDIVFSPDESSGLFRVSTDGGTPEILTTPDQGKEEVSHRLPHCLPDGKGVLFTIMRDNYDLQPRVAVLDLKTRKWRDLDRGCGRCPVRSDGPSCLSSPRDTDDRTLRSRETRRHGSACPCRRQRHAGPQREFRHTTILPPASSAYPIPAGWCMRRAGSPPDNQNSLVWVDQDGRSELAASFKAPFFAPRLSPDGHRIVYSGRRNGIGRVDL